MFNFTFSGSFSEENYKDQFFEVELNTWMDGVGYFRWRVMFSGKCSQEKLFGWNRKLKWSQIQKSVYQDNSVHGNHLFLCLNELAQGTLAKLCLFKAIPVGQHPKGCLKGSMGRKGLQRLTLALGLLGCALGSLQKAEAFRNFQGKRGFTNAGESCECEYWVLTKRLRFET
jgi:hypothetical protein